MFAERTNIIKNHMREKSRGEESVKQSVQIIGGLFSRFKKSEKSEIKMKKVKLNATKIKSKFYEWSQQKLDLTWRPKEPPQLQSHRLLHPK